MATLVHRRGFGRLSSKLEQEEQIAAASTAIVVDITQSPSHTTMAEGSIKERPAEKAEHLYNNICRI
ncbi:hypothetical protein [Candidatus Nitrososphaera evergladensis]|uniref:hypothetical protein n=1 Tax=Candidatus Nitrososphaera evergladensis TaxID=1459637 RepID=UPI0011E5BBFA|nr:hypothetical protein [Candidatus Nitrososphaera evergladensis]